MQWAEQKLGTLTGFVLRGDRTQEERNQNWTSTPVFNHRQEICISWVPAVAVTVPSGGSRVEGLLLPLIPA